MQELPKIGDVLDDTYQLLGLLGQGGFGAVYLARQLNMDRDVALKVLIAGGPKFDEMVKRFRREVMAIRNLTHPNTIRIYDFYQNASGPLYYTMEALKGETIKDELSKNGPISPRRTRYMLRQVLKSLSEAHSQGIVHRDLKPANIMIADMHGETDFIKVLDFGIAKLINAEEEEENEQLTSAGILVGTLRYMAPEQITGEALGPQSDLYALALIAIEMLSGESVFAGSGRWDILHQQISHDPVTVPECIQNSALGPVLLQALQKRPQARYQSADLMLAALDAVPESALSDQSLYVRGPAGIRPRLGGPALESRPATDVSDMRTEISDVHSEISAIRTRLDAPPREYQPRPPVEPTSPGFERATPQHHTPAPAPVAATPALAMNRPLTQPELQPGFQSAPAKKKSRAPMIAIVVIVLLLGAGAAFVVLDPLGSGSPGEQGPEVHSRTEGEQVAILETTHARGEEPLAEPAEEVEPTLIRIETGSVEATVYLGREVIGDTPLRFPVRENVELRVEAEGYEPARLRLGPDSPELMQVELESIAKPRAEETPQIDRSTTKVSASSKTRDQDKAPKTKTPEPSQPDRGWLEIEPRETPKTETKTKKKKPVDDWVDIAPKAAPKKKDDSKVEIPLF